MVHSQLLLVLNFTSYSRTHWPTSACLSLTPSLISFFSTIEHGEFFEVSNASLSMNRSAIPNIFSDSVASEFILSVHEHTRIVASSSSLLDVALRARPRSTAITLSEFDQCSLDTLVDVDAVIVSVGELTQGRKCAYRRVTLVDHTIDVENAVTLALWREQAIHFKGTEGELLRLQASKVTSYLKSYRHIGSLSHESIT